MTYPKVYIILINYNGWADTIECLESVLRNDYPNYQVIVVDNNSPNNSIEYLKAWAEGKLDVWVNSDNPLRNLSFPLVPKPIPYIYYTREEAEKGGSPEIEEELKNKIPKHITSKYPLVFIQSGGNLGFAGGNNVVIKYALVKGDFNSTILESGFKLYHVINSEIWHKISASSGKGKLSEFPFYLTFYNRIRFFLKIYHLPKK
jgi:GT2 family glycosyltransferase